MKKWVLSKKPWGLALVSLATLVVGAIALESCAGEGGPILPPGGGGGGSINAQFLALMPPGQHGASYVGPTPCKNCHNGQGGGNPVYHDWTQTKHFAKGVTCENCHGPASKHVANPTTANILTYPNSNNPVVCAQCHGPIANDWAQSPHAQLAGGGFPVMDAANDPEGAGKTQRCIVCHSGLMRGLHTENGDDILSLPDSEIVNVANETLNKVPFTASCATCHDPHKKLGNTNLAGEDVQLWHPEANTDITAVAPGTKPPSFTQFNQVCAECHNGWGANPTDASLNASTGRPSFHDGPQYNMLMGYSGVDNGGLGIGSTTHASMAGQCAKCHMPNSRHTFTVSLDTSCSPCHTPTDAANRAATIQAQTESSLLALQTRMSNWATKTFGFADYWEYTANISEANSPDQNLIPIEVKRARYNYHFILNDRSLGPHNAAYTNRLIQVANANLDSIGIGPVSPTRNLPPSQMKAILFAELKRDTNAELRWKR